MTTASKLCPVFAPLIAFTLLSACGGGGSGDAATSVTTYQVSATAGAGGTISPASATVNAGGTTTLTVTASGGYAISNVTGCGGTLSGNTFTTGAINASCAVTASFVAQYAVTATAGAGGTISPASTTVNAGGTTTLTVTASSGYAISNVTGCGGTLSGNTFTTGAINANCAVTASFIAQYAVTATAGAGGTVSPASTTVNAGGTARVTVTASSGYAISSVTGCGGTLSGNTYTTGAINANCAVTASFIAQYVVTTSAGTGGALSPTSATVNAGSTTTFTVTPTSGYLLSGLTGCGGSLSGNTYTTGPISGSCTVTATFSASGAFTWVNGPTNGVQTGVYGIKGVSAATNVPGVRTSSAAWTDAGGNLWIFGGFGIDHGSTTTQEVLNDLWEYSPSSGEWTWVGGSDTAIAPGVYGTKGSPASTNMPGARQNAVTWTDASGKVWLFGGTGYDSTCCSGSSVMNDLWVYSPSSGEWTWVGGSNTAMAAGVYGTRGSPDPMNVPGARFGAVGWQDTNGNLWLFGGWGSDSTGSLGYFNDVWEYSPSSGEWTWVSGTSLVSGGAVYGSPGVTAASNVPGGRYDAVSWRDADGNLWLFGGSGLDYAGAIGILSDLWMFSPAMGEWTWVGGSNTAQVGVLTGSQCTAAAANAPGARRDATGWMDGAGNLWLFGGWGCDSNGKVGYLNDLWKYSPSSGEWVWVQGSSTANALENPGTKGLAALTNIPGGRSQMISVKDLSGNVWLFGGFGYGFNNSIGFLNELWTYPAQ
jgi:N-acetylneuraminic acid mutarotase